jgi:hypothetical protein
VILRNENFNDMAQLETEREDEHGYYPGDVELNQDMTDDGINHTEVSVIKMHIREGHLSPVSDDEDEHDVEDEVENGGYHPTEETADDLAKERIMKRMEQAFLKREGEGASKKRKI